MYHNDLLPYEGRYRNLFTLPQKYAKPGERDYLSQCDDDQYVEYTIHGKKEKKARKSSKKKDKKDKKEKKEKKDKKKKKRSDSVSNTHSATRSSKHDETKPVIEDSPTFTRDQSNKDLSVHQNATLKTMSSRGELDT